MEPGKKRMLLEKKKGRQGLLRINLNYKRREQKSTFNHGFSNSELRFIKQTRRNFNVNSAMTIYSRTLLLCNDTKLLEYKHTLSNVIQYDKREILSTLNN